MKIGEARTLYFDKNSRMKEKREGEGEGKGIGGMIRKAYFDCLRAK